MAVEVRLCAKKSIVGKGPIMFFVNNGKSPS